MDKELIYLAGLFDGEGYCGIERRRPSTYRRWGYQLRCSVTMTDPRPLEIFHSRFGGSFMKLTRKRGKDCWQWSITSNKALAFLNEVKDYLIVKDKVALIGEKFQSKRSFRKVSRSSDEEYVEETKLYEEMRKANARWGTEYYQGS